MRPLKDLLVLDFSTLLPGPMATLLLAEAGADVVKIERPGSGDDMRGYKPAWGRDSANFALLNRGKKSVALDLKDPADRKKLDPLLEKADVLVEQFRPGVMKRLGLDYDTLRARNPGLVYCSITGYGQSGPKSLAAGHDLNYIGDAGLLGLSMGAPTNAVVPPALIADIGGGAYPAVMNIVLAVMERRYTGEGRYLDVAMSDNLFPFLYWAMGQGLGTGDWPGNGTELVTGGTARYRLYGTKDGQVVAAAPIEQKFWENFCDLIGLESEYRDDSRDPGVTAERVAAIIASETAQVWASRFATKDCCASIVAHVRDALDDPHFRARGLFDRMVSNDAGQVMTALPVPINDAFRGERSQTLASPSLGQDNKDLAS